MRRAVLLLTCVLLLPALVAAGVPGMHAGAVLARKRAASVNVVLCDFTTVENPVSCGGLLDTPIDSDSSVVMTAAGGVTVASGASCSAGHCGAWYTGALGNTQEAFITVPDATGSGTSIVVWNRLQDEGTAAPDGYFFVVVKQAGTDDIEIRRFDNGSPTTLTSGTQELNDGDTMCLHVSGIALTAFIDSGAGWVEVLSTTDATYASGTIGYTMFTNTLSGDDFGGGDGGFACVP